MRTLLNKEKKRLFLASLMIICGQLLHIYSATINATALNELIALRWHRFLLQEIYLMVVWAGLIFFDWLSTNYQMLIIQDLNIHLRKHIANQIAHSSYQAFHQHSSNTYLSWLNHDIRTVNQQAFEQVFLIVKGIAGTTFAIIALFQYHWSLVLFTFFSLIMMLLIPKLFSQKMQKVSLATTHQHETFLKEAENTLNDFPVFLSLNLVSQIPKYIVKASVELKKVILHQTSVEAAVKAIGFSSNIFFQISLTVLTGYLAIQGLIQIGTIEATGALAGIIFTTIGELSGQLSFVNGTKQSLKS